MIFFLIAHYTAEFDTTYEYVDSPPKSSAKTDISVKFNTASEKISTDPPLIQRISTERVAHAHYYDEGPNASQPPELPARTIRAVGVHSPEKSANSINSVCHYAETKLANGEQNVYAGDPTLSESFGVRESLIILQRFIIVIICSDLCRAHKQMCLIQLESMSQQW